MSDSEKTKEMLVQEVGVLQHRVDELEKVNAEVRRAERAVKQSYDFLESMINAIPDPIFAKDEQHRWVVLNDAACEAMGQPRDQLIGKTDYDLFPKEQADVFWEKDDLVLRTGGPEFNEEEITWQGKIHIIATRKCAFTESLSGKSFITGTIRDVTDRKRAEEALRESEERLNILFEFAPDAYYLNDLKGVFVDGNRAALHLSGYKGEELIGKNFLKLGLMPSTQIPRAAKLLAVNAMGQPTGPDEFTLNRKDGEQVPIEIRTFPVKIKGRDLVLAIARDITTRKEAEDALHRAQDELETRVWERTAELSQANEAL